MKNLRQDTRLAEGEATGHYHNAVGVDVKVYGDGDYRRLESPEGCTITHQEHKEIVLPPGNYAKEPVQEWDYDEQLAKSVID